MHTNPEGGMKVSRYSYSEDSRQRVMDTRKNRLLEELEQYNTNHTHMIEREEAKMILDQRLRHTGKIFDDELLDAIFNNTDKDLNGRISKQEFCQAYINVESFFIETIDTSNYKILELKNTKNDYEAQLREVIKSEVTNQYGIMENSSLTITVIEARNITPSNVDGKTDFYVLLECSNQSIQTKHTDNFRNPIWHETFEFDIYSGKEEIKVSILERNMMSQDVIIGVLYIPIIHLSDQVRIEDWYSLETPDGRLENGKIRLQLWWIHSKIKLLEDRIFQTESDIEKILEEKKYYQNKVKELREPFPWMEHNTTIKQSPVSGANRSSNNVFSSTTVYKEEIEIEEELQANPIIRVTNNVSDREKLLARGFERLADNLMQNIGIRYTPWYKVMQIINVLYAVMTLCI